MTPKFFNSEKGRVAWYSTGNGKPVLILHGWGSNSRVMMPLANQLQGERTSYLIDFPGFGESDEPQKSLQIDDFADITEEFASTIIETDSFDLIVHSFGARVALKLLTRPEFSDRIDKVVFTGAAGLKPKRSLNYYFKKYTAKILKLPFFILPKKAREQGLNSLRQTALWKSLGSSDYQKLSGVMRDTFVSCVNEHLDHLLPQIKHEILLIWGEDDSATPLDQGKRMNQLLNKSSLVEIKNAGHYAFLDKPKHFSSIVRAYFKDE